MRNYYDYEREEAVRKEILETMRGRTVEFDYRGKDAIISDNGQDVYIGFLSKQKHYDSLEAAISEKTFGSQRLIDIWEMVKSDLAPEEANARARREESNKGEQPKEQKPVRDDIDLSIPSIEERIAELQRKFNTHLGKKLELFGNYSMSPDEAERTSELVEEMQGILEWIEAEQSKAEVTWEYKDEDNRTVYKMSMVNYSGVNFKTISAEASMKSTTGDSELIVLSAHNWKDEEKGALWFVSRFAPEEVHTLTINATSIRYLKK